MELLEQLRNLGLNESEGRVYLCLLENGLSTPPKLAKSTGIMRTHCYNILVSLTHKGLVEDHKVGKRKSYLAVDPTALIRAIDKKREEAERLLPYLRALYTIQKNKPKVHFYDGLEEVKQIYLQAAQAEEVFGVGSTKSLAALDHQFWIRFLKQCKTNGVIFHDILTYSSGAGEGNEMSGILGALYDYELLPREAGDQPTDILIFGDNIALVTLEEPIFGTLLFSPLLARTFRVIWRIMHKGVR